MSTLVMKFGGTSVGTSSAILQTANIVKQHKTHWDNIVVVVSAMSGITDKLILSARKAAINDGLGARSIIDEINKQHQSVINDLITNPEEKQEVSYINIIYMDYIDNNGNLYREFPLNNTNFTLYNDNYYELKNGESINLYFNIPNNKIVKSILMMRGYYIINEKIIE